MKRNPTPPRRHSRQSVLQVRVMSPRIAWFGFLKYAGLLAKTAGVLGLCSGVGYGAWRGIHKALYQNSDFRLRVITLNDNPVIDELGVAAAAGIHLATNPSLFDIDEQDVCAKLKDLPAIADAHVERHLPGTLAVSVVARTPIAWITGPAVGLTATRHPGNLLVDHSGVAYPCPDRQLQACAGLPVIELPESGACPLKAGGEIRQPELEHCYQLLDAARDADPDAMQWIASVKQVNEWSLLLVTRQGTAATFGLGDHTRQIESLRAALDHAGDKGYLIDTINLIPKYNIPITLRAETARTAGLSPHPLPAKPTAEHAESIRSAGLSPHTPSAKPTASRAKAITSRPESTPPRAKPVPAHAQSTPPRAIPVIAQQDTTRGHDARRTRDSSAQHN